MVVIPLIPILTVCFTALTAFVATWAWLHSTYRKSTALYEHELERYETLHAIRSGITTQEATYGYQDANNALKMMASAMYHQPIEPYVPPPSDAMPIVRLIAPNEPIAWIDKAGEVYYPPEPEPRYELVMHDEGMVSGDEEVDHGKVGVS